MKKCDKAISEKMILYLPYVKPSQYLNEENRNKLSAGVTYKTTKIHEFVQFPSKRGCSKILSDQTRSWECLNSFGCHAKTQRCAKGQR